MKHLVEVKDSIENVVILKKEFQTKDEAFIFIEEAVDDDLDTGAYEHYDYFLNGELID